MFMSPSFLFSSLNLPFFLPPSPFFFIFPFIIYSPFSPSVVYSCLPLISPFPLISLPFPFLFLPSFTFLPIYSSLASFNTLPFLNLSRVLAPTFPPTDPPAHDTLTLMSLLTVICRSLTLADVQMFLVWVPVRMK